MDFAQQLSDISREEKAFTLQYEKKQLALADKLEDFDRRCSPFLRLPGEIRNNLYSYSVKQCHIHVCVTPADGGLQYAISTAPPQMPDCASDLATQEHFPGCRRRQRHVLALLHVCGQIHRETDVWTFSPHKYCIQFHDSDHFLERIAQVREKSIRALRIAFPSKIIQDAGAVDSLSKSLQPLVINGQLKLFTLVVDNPFLMGAVEKLLIVADDLRRSSLEISPLAIKVSNSR